MSDHETKTKERFEAVRVEFSMGDDESARRIEAVLGALGFNAVRDHTRHETNSKTAVSELREAANVCFEALASMNPRSDHLSRRQLRGCRGPGSVTPPRRRRS